MSERRREFTDRKRGLRSSNAKVFGQTLYDVFCQNLYFGEFCLFVFGESAEHKRHIALVRMDGGVGGGRWRPRARPPVKI